MRSDLPVVVARFDETSQPPPFAGPSAIGPKRLDVSDTPDGRRAVQLAAGPDDAARRGSAPRSLSGLKSTGHNPPPLRGKRDSGSNSLGMKCLLVACGFMFLSTASFAIQAENASGVMGGGVYCAIANGQCVPVGSFFVEARSPATGNVIEISPTRAVTVRLDCVDIAYASEGVPGSADSLSASGLDAGGNRWLVLAQQFADGRIWFSILQQEPDAGVCGFGDGLIPGHLTRGRFIFFRA